MIEVREVRTRKERKDFLEFPLKLYKGCKYYSPNLYISEKDLFKESYFYYKTCEAVYYNAYKDGKMVGRIGGNYFCVLKRLALRALRARFLSSSRTRKEML